MKRLLTPRRALGLLVLVTVSTSSSLRAKDAGRMQSLSFAAGWFDFNRQRDEAFETRLEYRWDRNASAPRRRGRDADGRLHALLARRACPVARGVQGREADAPVGGASVIEGGGP
jgi:hypothetical protein